MQLPISSTLHSLRHAVLCLAAISAFTVLPPAMAQAGAKKPRENPALAPIQDEPGLPRVLLIGDSVSIAYTTPVRELLKGKANVHRIPGNGTSTKYGLTKLQSWLGDGRWDVIHFNFGLHDAKLPPEGLGYATPETYEKNLREIVGQLKATGAKLVWASSTPVPGDGQLSPTRRFASVDAYNTIAKKVMEENGVAIDDLNTAVRPHLAEYQRPNDVHYNDQGSNFLAERVAASIAAQLPAK